MRFVFVVWVFVCLWFGFNFFLKKKSSNIVGIISCCQNQSIMRMCNLLLAIRDGTGCVKVGGHF